VSEIMRKISQWELMCSIFSVMSEKRQKFRLRLKIEKDIPVGRPTALNRLFEGVRGQLGARSMIVTFGWKGRLKSQLAR